VSAGSVCNGFRPHQLKRNQPHLPAPFDRLPLLPFLGQEPLHRHQQKRPEPPLCRSAWAIQLCSSNRAKNSCVKSSASSGECRCAHESVEGIPIRRAKPLQRRRRFRRRRPAGGQDTVHRVTGNIRDAHLMSHSQPFLLHTETSSNVTAIRACPSPPPHRRADEEALIPVSQAQGAFILGGDDLKLPGAKGPRGNRGSGARQIDTCVFFARRTRTGPGAMSAPTP